MEGLVLALVFLSPWAFGAVDPRWEFWLYLGIAILLVLWAMRGLTRFQLSWKHCPVAYCLAGLVLLASWQLVPLPHGILAAISPATARLYDRLLPAEPEQLAGPTERPVTSTGISIGSTISVYRYATRRETVHLLVILLVYALVRNNLAGPGYAMRFSIAGLVTGAALAFFSLIQFFTSAPNVIYWSIPTENMVFGPFICKNHFPFYVNLCFGLGLGLLCGQLTGRRVQEPGRDGLWRQGGFRFASLFDLLRQPQVLWISMFLILMATSIVFSLSRGGLLAFLGGGLVCLTLFFRRSARFAYLTPSFLIVAGSLALLTWFGLERVQTRLGTLFQSQVWKDVRVSLLSRAPPLIKDYPLLGTGFGSLDYVEPIYRTDATDAGWSYQHAHNEYLEAQIEGGLVGLTLTLLVLGLVFRQGLRACRHWEGRSVHGLVLGGLFGITTLALHNFVDFGIHLPAIALLATVLCAHLSALSDKEVTNPLGGGIPENGRQSRHFLLGQGLPLLVAATVFMSLGLFLVAEGYRGAEVRRLQQAALALQSATKLADQKTRIAFLEEALRLNPANARLHFDVAERYAELFETLAQKQVRQEAALPAVQAVLLLNPGCTPASGATATISFLFRAKIDQDHRKRIVPDLAGRYLTPALRHFLTARDQCPARAKVHMEIAYYREFLKKAEPRRNYLDRALYLDPTNPEFWYRAGTLELRDGRLDQAAQDWRRSLELSDALLSRILARGASRFTSQELLDRVLPENPGTLVAAAAYLYPKTEAPERRPFLEKARRLYREALNQKPFQVEWRFELARLLFEQEQFQETRQELLTVLAVAPRHGPALALLSRTERAIVDSETRRAIEARKTSP